MTVEQLYLPEGALGRPGLPIKTGIATSITIHWIGPYPKQSVYDPRVWWLKGPDGKGITASAHYIVKDTKVLQCIPYNEIAYHAGCREGNNTSLGIEVIPTNKDGLFDDITITTLKELITDIRKDHGNLDLVRHYDWTKKDCPRWYTLFVTDGDKHWQELKEYLNG